MSVAHRYAAATLANVPQSKSGQAEDVSHFQSSVAALATALQTPALLQAVRNPRLTPAQRTQLATTCAKAAEAPPALQGLLHLLAAKRRINLLPEILAEIQAQMEAQQGLVPLTVHSAVPLTDTQKIQLKMMVKQHTKARDVVLEEVLKPNLLGGFRAFFKGMVWEQSVGGQLARLKAQLKHAANQ